MKKILVVGSGAREHAIVAAFKRSRHQPALFCCGSSYNPAIANLTQDYWKGNIKDCGAIGKQAQAWDIDLAFIGPEAPLEQGLTDHLQALGIAVIGPTKALAQIESSKHFARDLMQKYSIAGLPRFNYFAANTGIKDFLQSLGEGNYVIKADGLMGGKGVKVAGDHLFSLTEALAYCEEILASGQGLVIEEKLIGQEFSLLSFCDGSLSLPMPIVQDHKRAFVGDLGPNTGGMGSYTDANHSLPFLTEEDIKAAAAINQAVLSALAQDLGQPYRGILYGGYMVTAKGVYVIEFNARFGDPEALNLLSLLDSDLLDLSLAMVEGRLKGFPLRFAHKASVCKYAVPEGYPDKPLAGEVVDFSQVPDQERLYLGAVDLRDQQIIATGSRTAAYVGIADTLAEAEQLAEEGVSAIKGPLFHREDIGTADLIQQRVDFMLALRSKTCA